MDSDTTPALLWLLAKTHSSSAGSRLDADLGGNSGALKAHQLEKHQYGSQWNRTEMRWCQGEEKRRGCEKKVTTLVWLFQKLNVCLYACLWRSFNVKSKAKFVKEKKPKKNCKNYACLVCRQWYKQCTKTQKKLKLQSRNKIRSRPGNVHLGHIDIEI